MVENMENGPVEASASKTDVVLQRLRAVRNFSWAMALIATMAFAGYAGWRTFGPQQQVPTAKQISQSLIKSEFELIDHQGNPVTDEDYRGKWLLVFFGFTNCPDVCPTRLNQIAVVMDNLGDKAAKVQPLFITVDPERDTPERMAEFVGAFDSRITGLTGTPEQMTASTKSFKAYYAKAVQETAPDGYTMEHTASLYLIDPKGRFVRPYSYNATIEEMSDDLRERLQG